MKLIQRLTLLSSIALLAAACDLQQTFDERIDDKQLLVLSPDFADTSVQLVFRDPETLAVIDEDFEVTVYANKRLVDLNGNYKNEFIARGGVMEFSVSPEETVSESDPLEIAVEAYNYDNSKIVPVSKYSINASSFKNITIQPESVELNYTEAPEKPILNAEPIGQINKAVSDVKFELSFNGRTINDYGCFIMCIPLASTYLNVNGPYIHRISPEYYYTWGGYFVLHGASVNNLDTGVPPNSLTLLKDLDVEVKGPLSLADYTLSIDFWEGDDNPRGRFLHRYFIRSDGRFDFVKLNSDSHVLTDVNGSLNTNHRVTIKAGNLLGGFRIKTYPNEDYKSCDEGFNLNIEGAIPGLETNLLYKVTRDNDQEIFGFANLTINEPAYSYNSLQDAGDEQYISTSGNTLEFAENSQYIIEPSVIELGGEELCGNTYTVTLKRRDTHKMHNINLSMRNENQNVGVALTFSALLRKQGQSDAAWETVNFKQGSTSVYLEEGSTYEVKLTLADEPFEFTFTNDLSLVEAAVQATKRNVSRIKDIAYTIEQTAESNTIDAEIVFFEGQSLID